jgi:hypothetical protein
MAIFHPIKKIETDLSALEQIVDIVTDDISSAVNRRKYQTFVTESNGNPQVISSLFQTVYDQDFTLKTSNPMFDITVGVKPVATGAISPFAPVSVDKYGKEIFSDDTLMMREKFDIYREFSQTLLGDATKPFKITNGSSTVEVDVALFVSFKRLFTRDKIKEGSLAFTFLNKTDPETNPSTPNFFGNLFSPIPTGSLGDNELKNYTDSDATKKFDVGGQYGDIVQTGGDIVGYIFYDRGVLVLDLSKIINVTQTLTGRIDAANDSDGYVDWNIASAKKLNDLILSASIDDIVDHICTTRFVNDIGTSIAFANSTLINSTLYTCEVDSNQCTYSSNPTFVNPDDNRIVVIERGQENIQRSFAFVTSVGLYDESDRLLAVAKVSRPVEKLPGKSVSFRVRLDF